MTHFIRTLSNQPALPVPAGAVAGDWDQLTDAPDDLLRFLTWSRHDAAGVLNLKDVSCWISGFPQAIRRLPACAAR